MTTPHASKIPVDSRPLIAHVIYRLGMGGLENGLVNLINRLPPERYRHSILCIEDYTDFCQRIEREEVELIALKLSERGIWRVRKGLYRYFRQRRPAIVHGRNLAALDALLPARLAGVRHRLHGEHGRDGDDLYGDKLKPILLRRCHAPLVTRYITVSQDLERYLVNKIGIAPRRITQIYNGVDTERFTPPQGEARPWLPEGFCDEHSFVIGTVGRLQPLKDQTTLIKAFAQLGQAAPDFAAKARLVVVGDGPCAAPLRQLAAELGVQERILFPGAQEDIPTILQSVDLFVLASLTEGISNTVLEAMASGLPIVATAVGGNVELVEAGRTGSLFSPQDVDTLTQLLLDYGQRPDYRRQQGHAARQTALERYSLGAMMANYQQLYDQLITA